MSGTTSLEGEWNGAHTVSGCGTLPTGVRMQPQHQEWGKGEGRTGLSCRLPGPPVPRQRRSSLSLAQGRGIRKKSGMRSKESYFFFRSWEQRGQNLKTGKEQGKQKYEVKSVLSRSASLSLGTARPAPATATAYHFPRGLVVSPTQAKWNHSMEHWRGRWNTAVRGLRWRGEEPAADSREEPSTPALLPARPRATSPTTILPCTPSLPLSRVPAPFSHAPVPLRAPPPTLRQRGLTSGLSQPIISP